MDVNYINGKSKLRCPRIFVLSPSETFTVKCICQIKRWNTNPLKSHAITQPAEQCGRHYCVPYSTLSIKAAAWAAISPLTIVRRAFQTWKNVTAFNIWKLNLSSQGISLSTILLSLGSVKLPLCNDVTISHIWTSTSGDMNALKICACARLRRLLV